MYVGFKILVHLKHAHSSRNESDEPEESSILNHDLLVRARSFKTIHQLCLIQPNYSTNKETNESA